MSRVFSVGGVGGAGGSGGIPPIRPVRPSAKPDNDMAGARERARARNSGHGGSSGGGDRKERPPEDNSGLACFVTALFILVCIVSFFQWLFS